jgi:hypothetical protein
VDESPQEELQRDLSAPRRPGEPDLELVADSAQEDRAVTRISSLHAREDAQALRARAEAAQEEAGRARDLAVSALAEVDDLRRAMESRTDIDIAKGILVERYQVDPKTAFDMLVKESQRKGTKLVNIARALVRSVAADE